MYVQTYRTKSINEYGAEFSQQSLRSSEKKIALIQSCKCQDNKRKVIKSDLIESEVKRTISEQRD